MSTRRYENGRRAQLPNRIRFRIFLRDGWKCQYCGSQENICVDHKVAVSEGGTDDIDNLITSCQPCNAKKGWRDPNKFAVHRQEGSYNFDDKTKLMVWVPAELVEWVRHMASLGGRGVFPAHIVQWALEDYRRQIEDRQLPESQDQTQSA